VTDSAFGSPRSALAVLALLFSACSSDDGPSDDRASNPSGGSGTAAAGGNASATGGSASAGAALTGGSAGSTPTPGAAGTTGSDIAGSGGTSGGGAAAGGAVASAAAGTSGSAGVGGTTGSGAAGLIGFATLNGGTKGGLGGATVTAKTYTELQTYAESATPYVIMVSGTIGNGANGGRINVQSNKSLIGVGGSAFLNGVGLNIANANNIIVQNLRISLIGVTTRTDTAGVYSSTGDEGLAQIRADTCVRIEKNYYEALHYSIYTSSDSAGKTERIDNIEVMRTERAYPAACTADIPYSYSQALTNTTADVKTIVPASAGVGKL